MFSSLVILFNDNWFILETYCNFVSDNAFFLDIVCEGKLVNSVQLPLDGERNVCHEDQVERNILEDGNT
jgi:hypothetical protein